MSPTYYAKPNADGYRPSLFVVGANMTDTAEHLTTQGAVEITEARYLALQEHGRPAPVRRPHLLSPSSRRAAKAVVSSRGGARDDA